MTKRFLDKTDSKPYIHFKYPNLTENAMTAIMKRFEKIAKEIIRDEYELPDCEFELSPFDFTEKEDGRNLNFCYRAKIVDEVSDPKKEKTLEQLNNAFMGFGIGHEFAGEPIIIDFHDDVAYAVRKDGGIFKSLSEEYGTAEAVALFKKFGLPTGIPDDSNKPSVPMTFEDLEKNIRSVFETDSWFDPELGGEISFLKPYVVEDSHAYGPDAEERFEYVLKVSDGFAKLRIVTFGEDGITELSVFRVVPKEKVTIEYSQIVNESNIR